MAENHRRRIAHFGRSSVFIAILSVVIRSEAMTGALLGQWSTMDSRMSDPSPSSRSEQRFLSRWLHTSSFRLGAGQTVVPARRGQAAISVAVVTTTIFD